MSATSPPLHFHPCISSPTCTCRLKIKTKSFLDFSMMEWERNDLCIVEDFYDQVDFQNFLFLHNNKWYIKSQSNKTAFIHNAVPSVTDVWITSKSLSTVRKKGQIKSIKRAFLMATAAAQHNLVNWSHRCHSACL